LVEASTQLPQWRNAVVEACREAVGVSSWVTATGACRVEIEFFFVQAKSNKNDLPIGMPDIDKVCRSILDSLTMAEIWADDSQCVDLVASKRWAGEPGALIRVYPL
jgi:Holliday junction resolvase RusA-like endonuclease